MAVTDLEIAAHTLTLEQHFWAHRRPPLHLRDKVREGQRFAALITTDQKLRYQQNLSARPLAVLVLPTTDWRLIRLHTDYVAAAASKLAPGDYVELTFPPPPEAPAIKPTASS